MTKQSKKHATPRHNKLAVLPNTIDGDPFEHAGESRVIADAKGPDSRVCMDSRFSPPSRQGQHGQRVGRYFYVPH